MLPARLGRAQKLAGTCAVPINGDVRHLGQIEREDLLYREVVDEHAVVLSGRTVHWMHAHT
ncbi:hypothetical protein D3C84_1087960 [compost metagenome]